MKRWKRITAMAAAAALCWMSVPFAQTIIPTWAEVGIAASAADASYIEVDGITYTCTADGNAEVTSCDTSVTGAVVIPEEIDGYTVTSIGDSAFAYCSDMTSLTLPEGILKIGSYAFLECEKMTSIYIPDTVAEIGASAFYFCYALTSITIPEGITTIEDNTFSCCVALSSVTLPSTLTQIGEAAFFYCINLQTINLPEGLTSIGVEAFYYDDALTSITIPSSVTNIDEQAFSSTSLDTVYYTGTVDEWCAITIESENDELVNATIQYQTLPWNTSNTWNQEIYLGNSYDLSVSKTPTNSYQRFTPTKTATYVFYTSYTSSSLDTMGNLYDAQGNLLVTNNDSGEEDNFSIRYEMTAGETNFLGVSGYSASGSTYHTVAGGMPSDAVEPTLYEGVGTTGNDTYTYSYFDVSGESGQTITIYYTLSDGDSTSICSFGYFDVGNSQWVSTDFSFTDVTGEISCSYDFQGESSTQVAINWPDASHVSNVYYTISNSAVTTEATTETTTTTQTTTTTTTASTSEISAILSLDTITAEAGETEVHYAIGMEDAIATEGLQGSICLPEATAQLLADSWVYGDQTLISDESYDIYPEMSSFWTIKTYSTYSVLMFALTGVSVNTPTTTSGTLGELVFDLPDEDTVNAVAKEYGICAVEQADGTYYYEFPVEWMEYGTDYAITENEEGEQVLEPQNRYTYLDENGVDVSDQLNFVDGYIRVVVSSTGAGIVFDIEETDADVSEGWCTCYVDIENAVPTTSIMMALYIPEITAKLITTYDNGFSCENTNLAIMPGISDASSTEAYVIHIAVLNLNGWVVTPEDGRFIKMEFGIADEDTVYELADEYGLEIMEDEKGLYYEFPLTWAEDADGFQYQDENGEQLHWGANVSTYDGAIHVYVSLYETGTTQATTEIETTTQTTESETETTTTTETTTETTTDQSITTETTCVTTVTTTTTTAATTTTTTTTESTTEQTTTTTAETYGVTTTAAVTTAETNTEATTKTTETTIDSAEETTREETTQTTAEETTETTTKNSTTTVGTVVGTTTVAKTSTVLSASVEDSDQIVWTLEDLQVEPAQEDARLYISLDGAIETLGLEGAIYLPDETAALLADGWAYGEDTIYSGDVSYLYPSITLTQNMGGVLGTSTPENVIWFSLHTVSSVSPTAASGTLADMTFDIPDAETVVTIAQEYGITAIEQEDGIYTVSFPIEWYTAATEEAGVTVSLTDGSSVIVTRESFSYLDADGAEQFGVNTVLVNGSINVVVSAEDASVINCDVIDTTVTTTETTTETTTTQTEASTTETSTTAATTTTSATTAAVTTTTKTTTTATTTTMTTTTTTTTTTVMVTSSESTSEVTHRTTATVSNATSRTTSGTTTAAVTTTTTANSAYQLEIVEPETLLLYPGSTFQLSCLTDYNGSEPLVWSSLNSDTAEVDAQTGKVTILSTGTVLIGVHINGVSGVSATISLSVDLMKGDIDENGSVEIGDAYMALMEYANVAAGLSASFNGRETWAADVDENSTVDISDASYILQYYAAAAAGNTVTWHRITG